MRVAPPQGTHYSRRPPLPDYQSATRMAQLARRRQYAGHGRSHSTDGMLRTYRDDDDQREIMVDGGEDSINKIFIYH